MGFKHLIGNKEVKEELEKLVENNKVSHSYLFLGISGIGKTLFAKEFAKMILCQGNKQPCNQCKSCIEFEQQNQPDFHLIIPKEGNIKIEQIRKMQEKVIEKPIISDKKVYVIQDADRMTKEAQNCLLKTLEEPPKFITIILVASNESLLLNTIRSRCMKVNFQPIYENELKQYLEGKGFQNLNNELLMTFQGSIERANQINDKREVYEEIRNIFSNVEKKQFLDIEKQLGCLYENKEIIEELLDYVQLIFLEKAKQNTKYIDYIETIEQVKRNLKANGNYDMNIDKLIYKIWEE